MKHSTPGFAVPLTMFVPSLEQGGAFCHLHHVKYWASGPLRIAKSRSNRVSTKSANSGLAGLIRFAILKALTAVSVKMSRARAGIAHSLAEPK